MNRNIAGAEYVEAINASESDRLARSAFQSLALRLAPGGALLDFGAGPGIDARFYARNGLAVRAYDVDPIMCDYFAEHCRDLIAKGWVTLERGEYSQFLARDDSGSRVDLVTANFAPLNLVGDLNALFAKFHAATTIRGEVLASVLNPYYRGDLRYSWWWRNLPRLGMTGQYAVAGAQAPIVRRRLACLARLCLPYFMLERVYRGLPERDAAEAEGIDLKDGARRAWLHLTDCRFLFLRFRRRQASGTGTRIPAR